MVDSETSELFDNDTGGGGRGRIQKGENGDTFKQSRSLATLEAEFEERGI